MFEGLAKKGSFTVENDVLVFLPSQDEIKKKESNRTESEKSNSEVGQYLFNKRFLEGRVRVNVSFDDVSHDALCSIIFQNKQFNETIEMSTAGIHNSIGMCKLKRYHQTSWEDIMRTGEPNQLMPKTSYNMELVIEGSKITFLLNEIEMFSTNKHGMLTESNIGILCKNNFPVRIHSFEVESKKPKAFVVMQFTDKYNVLYNDLIKPHCEDFGYEVIRADETCTMGMIIEDIVREITDASIIIADITPDNPNVFYEVGYAHALNKPTILICDKDRERLPFDVSGFKTLFYEDSIGGKQKIETDLKRFLQHLKIG